MFPCSLFAMYASIGDFDRSMYHGTYVYMLPTELTTIMVVNIMLLYKESILVWSGAHNDVRSGIMRFFFVKH